ncbi:hypothetical protein DFH07DRAFT_952421 [Mycena maculata]|uniref:Uncharacterized protein n=1 Tax=Mycena maculata TaxID=230809 RepID=A0AAD7JXT2_9AGAR|nr:hypothetical protein DFH07DRAFT_952421 [Mycena maculata]
MSSAPYDRSLLAQAPIATRAQLQEGYDSVLLAPNRRANRTESDIALNAAVEPKATPQHAQPISRWPWRWKPAMALLITLVVIAVIVGGAVGGSLHKKRAKASTDALAGVGSAPLSLTSGIFEPPATPAASGSSSSSTPSSSQVSSSSQGQGGVAAAANAGSAAHSMSGIFGPLPSLPVNSVPSSSSQAQAVMTGPAAASDIFPQVPARHFVTARRR